MVDTVNMKRQSTHHHGNTKRELIDAAFLILDEDGVDAVGIREVARRVGVSHAAPAKHYKNKQALLTAMAIEVFVDLKSRIQNSRQDNELTLRDRIHHFSSTILSYGLKYPNRYKLAGRQELLNQDDSYLIDVMDSLYQELFTILEQSNKNIDIKSQAVAIWSLIHGYVLFRLDGTLIAAEDEVTGLDRQTAIIDVIIDGIE